jgi:hypothetical protein
MRTVIHVSLDIKGFLSTAVYPREYKRLLQDTAGNMLKPQEARAYLLDQLASGKRQLPMEGSGCEGFSFETGCPGHAEAIER